MTPNDLPIRNRITSQLSVQDGIVSLLMWDEDLFANMVLPDGVDSQAVIDCILSHYGKKPLMHPDPNYMKYYIGAWSKRKLYKWRELIKTTEYDYNPIENTDAFETYTDKRNAETNGTASNTRKTSGTASGTETGSSDTVNQLSAENVDSFQNDTKTSGSTSSNVNSENSETEEGIGKSSGTENMTFTHTLERHGNIGTMTTQYMIEEQRKIVDFSIEEVIANDFADEFCLLLWEGR